MSLSNDILDYILSFLQSDLVTLKTCAKSHPTLSKLSERYIYAEVTLCDDRDTEGIRSSEFTEIVDKSPDIAKHVRSLTVLVVHGTLLEEYVPHVHVVRVACLLPMFSGLTDLKIKGIDRSNCFGWPELPVMFQEAFLNFLHTRGKKTVTICRSSCFPLSLLNDCENVTMDHCKDTQYDKESTKDALLPCPGPFERLSLLRCSRACLESTVAWLQRHSLHSLEFDGEWAIDDVGVFLPRALVACSNSLTKLCLDIGILFRTSYRISNNSAIYDQNVVRFPFTFTGLCHLKSLTIKALIGLSYNPDDRRSPIPAIVNLISTAPPSFKQIFLEFRYTGWEFPDPEDVWLPFVPLAATCSPLSITVHISTWFMLIAIPRVPCRRFCSTGRYGGLTPYMEKGVVVVTPGVELQSASA